MALLMVVAACASSHPASQYAAPTSTDTSSSDLIHFSAECEDWDNWDKPARPFRIHNDTYYVGTCGISAILIAGDGGLVLIDSGTQAGSLVVEKNIAALGHSITDVKAILTSHEHFDHVGGLSRLQKLSGATVYTSAEATSVLRTGRDNPEDPQAGMHDPMASVAGEVRAVSDGEILPLAGVAITAIATPGHTPGAMSWQWESCDGGDCVSIVYADSMSPVSSDDYRFTDHAEYIALFRKSIARLAAVNCGILLTPHPSASDMLTRARRGTLEGGMACAEYANSRTTALNERLAKEVPDK